MKSKDKFFFCCISSLQFVSQEQQSFIVFGELLIIPILTFLWFWFEDFTAFFATLIEKYIFTLIFEVGFNLPYSRLLEAEADTVGLTLSTKACYDPRWAVLLWEKMSFKVFHLFFLFYFCIYPPDSQESDGDANALDKQLPRPAFGDAKILLFACNLIEI